MIITILLCGLSFFFGVFFTFYIFKRFYGLDLFKEVRAFNQNAQSLLIGKSNQIKKKK